MRRKEVYKRIEEMFGLVPSMFKVVPDSSLELEWQLFKRVQFDEGPIPNKYPPLLHAPRQPRAERDVRRSVAESVKSFTGSRERVCVLQEISLCIVSEHGLYKRGPRTVTRKGIDLLETGDAERVRKLTDLVERHAVVYEALPHEEIVESMCEGKLEARRVKVGFNLDLYGTYGHGHSRLTPDCLDCLQTFRDLREIAEWIMPANEDLCDIEIEAFDQALHESPTRGHRFEVALNLRILHRHGWDQPIDEAEERCLRKLEKNLAQLGVKRGS